MEANTQPKPSKEQRVIVRRMGATLEAMRDSELIAEIVQSKIAEGEHPLYAQALGAEVRRRIKRTRLHELKAKQEEA